MRLKSYKEIKEYIKMVTEMVTDSLLKFKLHPGTKYPIAGYQWSRPKLQVRGAISGNHAVVCGETNNLIVLDLDTAKWDAVNWTWFKQFIPDITAVETFIVQTQSGGYHLYFQHDPDIPTQIIDKRHQIDVKGGRDGKVTYVVAPGSTLNGKSYVALNQTAIQPMPSHIKSFILEQLEGKASVPKSKKQKRIHNLVQSTISIHNTLWKVTARECELRFVLAKLPRVYLTDYSEWLVFTTFMKLIDQHALWEELSAPHDTAGTRENVWQAMTVNPAETHDYTHSILAAAQCLWFKPYLLYKATPADVVVPDFVHDPAAMAQGKYLGKPYFSNIFYPEHTDRNLPRKCCVVKSDKGTGKTTSLLSFLRDHNHKKPFLSIVSRIVLGQDHHSRFNRAQPPLPCEFYLDSEFQTALTTQHAPNIVITIDSILKLGDTLDLSAYTVVLDEWNSTVEYLLAAGTMSERRVPCFVKLLEILDECEQVIACDADITDQCFDIFKHLTIPFWFFLNPFRPNLNVPAREFIDEKAFISALIATPKWLLATDSKNVADHYGEMLTEQGVTFKLYTSDNTEPIDMDEHPRLIFSPKIVYGLDSTLARPVFVVYKEHTISPRNMLQQISRCRHITQLNYLLTKKRLLKETFDSPRAAYTSLLRSDADLVARFQLLCDSGVNALFLKMLSTVRFNLDCFQTNKFGHFLAQLQAEGFRDTTVFGPTFFDSMLHRKLQDRCVERKIAGFDPSDEAVELINQYLQIPEGKIDSFAQDLLQFNRSFTLHLCVSNLFFSAAVINKARLRGQKDFNVMKIKNARSKVVFVQDLVARFGDATSLTTAQLRAPEEWAAADATRLRYKHKQVFGRATKADLESSAGLTKLLRECLRPLVPPKLYVKTQRGSGSRKTRFREWMLDDKALERHRTVFAYRQPIKQLEMCEACERDLLDCCC